MILAGGRSLRMGRDKASLEIGGVPLIQRVRDALAVHCDEVIVVGLEDSAKLAGVRSVPDLRPGREGPLAGMESGLTASRNPLVFVAATDLPFIPAELVGYLLKRVANDKVRAVVPRWRGRPHPLCAAYDRGILSSLGISLDSEVRAVREMLEGVEGVEYVEEGLRRFGDPDVLLMNVNEPGDLDLARTLLRDRGR